jgi:hypothetical protein
MQLAGASEEEEVEEEDDGPLPSIAEGDSPLTPEAAGLAPAPRPVALAAAPARAPSDSNADSPATTSPHSPEAAAAPAGHVGRNALGHGGRPPPIHAPPPSHHDTLPRSQSWGGVRSPPRRRGAPLPPLVPQPLLLRQNSSGSLVTSPGGGSHGWRWQPFVPGQEHFHQHVQQQQQQQQMAAMYMAAAGGQMQGPSSAGGYVYAPHQEPESPTAGGTHLAMGYAMVPGVVGAQHQAAPRMQMGPSPFGYPGSIMAQPMAVQYGMQYASAVPMQFVPVQFVGMPPPQPHHHYPPPPPLPPQQQHPQQQQSHARHQQQQQQ